MQDVFKVSSDVSPTDHIRMQAAFQMFTHNAVSKTINFDNDVTEEEISDAMILAYELGCKGTTVYRNGSRNNQPLTKGEKSEDKTEEPELIEIKKVTKEEAPICIECALPDEEPIGNGVVVKTRPNELVGKTKQVATGCGTLFVTVNEAGGEIYETFLKSGATGGCAAFTEGTARLISVALRYGVPVGVIIDQLKSVRCDNFRYQSGKNPSLKGKSCPDVIGNVLQEYKKHMEEGGSLETIQKIIEDNKEDILTKVMSSEDGTIKMEIETERCPDCGVMLLFTEGCVVCHNCGYSHC